jgi:predicted DNA-binding transcriptional regulator AlpA
MGNAAIGAPVRIKVREFAQREGISESTAWLWVRKGIAPPSYLLGGSIRVMDLDDVLKWERDLKAEAR